MIISRLFGAITNSLESIGNIIASGSSLVETEVNALKENRKADHLITYKFGSELKVRHAHEELERVSYRYDQKAKAKGKTYYDTYNEKLEKRLQLLDLLQEDEED